MDSELDKRKMSREEDAEVIRCILDGDKEAFSKLQNKYKYIVSAIVRKVIRDEDDVDDLTQETFIKAYRAISTFNFDYAFSSWLYKIASNACIDFLRKKRYYTVSLSRPMYPNNPDYIFEVEDTNSLPDIELIKSEKAEVVEAAIAALPEKYRTIINLRHSEELDYAEIAERLKLPLGTVKVNLFRARKMLGIALRKHSALFDLKNEKEEDK